VIATYLYSQYETPYAIAAFALATTGISLIALYALPDPEMNADGADNKAADARR
jgi:hypothetical protein